MCHHNIARCLFPLPRPGRRRRRYGWGLGAVELPVGAVRVAVAVYLLGTAALIARRVITGRVSRPLRAAGGGFPDASRARPSHS